MQKKSHFKETQKFTQWWLWLILIGTSLIPLYGIYIQVLLEKSFGDSPMSNSGLIIFALASFLILFLFYSIQLDTRINKDEILVKFKPFIKKKVPWDKVHNTEIVDYGFVGGWGIRFSSTYGTVYNIKGKKGLAIELKNGKKILIGTQNEEEMKVILEQLKEVIKE